MKVILLICKWLVVAVIGLGIMAVKKQSLPYFNLAIGTFFLFIILICINIFLEERQKRRTLYGLIKKKCKEQQL